MYLSHCVAFEEWSACAMATQCLKYLYSLSINPDPRQGGLTRAQYFDLIERAEKELGLSGQPRAVVFHVHNDGREPTMLSGRGSTWRSKKKARPSRCRATA